jgi:hypothetical protein
MRKWTQLEMDIIRLNHVEANVFSQRELARMLRRTHQDIGRMVQKIRVSDAKEMQNYDKVSGV